jgi:hypothetical protein
MKTRVLHLDVDVVFDGDPGGDYGGYTDNPPTITINSAAPKIMQARTMVHERFHAEVFVVDLVENAWGVLKSLRGKP